MAGMLGIGLSGLNVAQLNLNTTSHNISNANTPGYSRQLVSQLANDPEFSGVGFFGNGVQVGNVTRRYNEFLDTQVRNSQNRFSEFQAYGAQISQINNLLADPEVGLSPVLNQFFATVQDVAANPTSIPARQAMLSTAESVSARIRAMDGRVQEVREGTEAEIAQSVERINSIGRDLAELNQRIALAQASGSQGYQANDLQDQRNELLLELNTLISARGVIERDGQMSVFIGSGQVLVQGTSTIQLKTVTNDPNDPSRQTVVVDNPGGSDIVLPERLLRGGTLGGLLSFRGEVLDQTQNQLDLIARNLIEVVNGQHRLGIDLNGVAGGDFFAPSMVRPEGAVTGDAPEVRIVDDGLLDRESYRLEWTSPSTYTLERVSDGAVIADPVTELGLSITIPDNAVTGESFVITPLRDAARSITLSPQMSDPARIAAGSAVSIDAAGNAGSASAVLSAQPDQSVAYPPSFELSFDATNAELTGLPPGYAFVPDGDYDPTVDSPKEFTITDGTQSFTFRLSGVPSDGDTFAFSFDSAVPGDNRNMLAIAALQTTQVMLTGADGTPRATLQSAYSQLVSFVGNKAREAQTGERAQESLLQQARDARESFSGVNLDEEAANLIRFQQAYQASARVMTVAQRLFDEVLSFGR